jgi:hypothetical protein
LKWRRFNERRKDLNDDRNREEIVADADWVRLGDRDVADGLGSKLHGAECVEDICKTNSHGKRTGSGSREVRQCSRANAAPAMVA